jgi:hypothetical protein
VSVPDDIDTSQFKHGVAQMKKSAHFGMIFPQPSRVGTSQPKSSVTLQRSNSLRHTKPPPPSSLPGLLVALPSALPQFVEPNRGCQPQPATRVNMVARRRSHTQQPRINTCRRSATYL